MDKRNARLGTRCRASDKKKWQQAAQKEGISLSSWIERLLNAEIERGKAK
jgi:predicted HicB family RNase H-like nuclease